MKIYLVIHTVKYQAVFHLSNLAAKGISLFNNFGKICNRGNELSVESANKIGQHILLFPCKESHYSSKLIKYLFADLFYEQYLDLTDVFKYRCISGNL